MIMPQIILVIWFGLSAIGDSYYIGITNTSEDKTRTVKQTVYILGLLFDTMFVTYLLL